MLGSYTKEEFEEVASYYSDEFLEDICCMIGIKEDKRDNFKNRLVDYSAKYLYLKNANAKNRVTPTKQNEKIEAYRQALLELESRYQKMRDDNASLSKLHKAIRIKLEALPKDSPMIEMFKPYITDGGIAVDFFVEFINFIQVACEDAKEIKIGKDKTNISNEVLTYWVAVMKNFIEDLVPEYSIALGDYYKEIGGYKSPSIDVLYSLINQIDSSITKKNIETSIRKVNKKENINQHPAYFLFQ